MGVKGSWSRFRRLCTLAISNTTDERSTNILAIDLGKDKSVADCSIVPAVSRQSAAVLPEQVTAAAAGAVFEDLRHFAGRPSNSVA
jgi:ribosomal silencing factor RsfS